MRRLNRITRRKSGERGIAIIASIGVLVVIAAIMVNFSDDADIEYEAAKNAESEMQAHFLARSGINLAELVVKVQTDVLDRYRQYIGDLQLADYLPYFIGAFGGNAEEVEALGAMVSVDTSAITGLGLPNGEFDVKVTTDDGKTNVNCAGGSEASRQSLALQLAAMLLPTAYDGLFETQDAEGYLRDRATQVAAIIDYIDRDNARFGADGTSEEYGYESVRDRYLPKNNYIDSVGELRLVRGVDDRLWTLFGSAFTAYGGCKLNVGAIQDVNVIASVIYASAKNADDPVLRDPVKLWALARFVAQARNFGLLFDDLNGFADFVKSPAEALGDLLAGDAGGAAAQNGAAGGALNLIPEGVELDRNKLNEVARAGPRRTYRVEAIAQYGRLQKRITAVWDTQVQRQNPREGRGGRGAWVFWKEE